jgi:hypothetical protein
VWRYPFFTPALGGPARELAAEVEAPLRLESRHRWDPDDEYWGEPGEALEPDLQAIRATGERRAWELEQRVPGRDWEAGGDPILDAVELARRAERERARGLLEGLLGEEPRCLDAHAHLGSLAFEYSAALALPCFEAGVAIGERSLPEAFDGVLPWGWIDNRPFLRCLHGYGLCLWRLGRLVDAEAVFVALLWLNPTDNQGARELVGPVRARMAWEPIGRGDGWAAPDAGRRALLDAAAPTLDASMRASTGEDVDAAFEPVLWLLGRAGDEGLPLTQTGALGQAIVREAVERFPSWWDSDLVGPPHQEAEVALLVSLRDLVQRSRLLRRRKRRLLSTARGRTAREDPGALLAAVAPRLIVGSPFEREVGELASAVLLVEREVSRDELATTLHGAVARLWRGDDGPVDVQAVDRALSPFLDAVTSTGALSIGSGWRLSLADAGAELLARSLTHVATAART